MVGCVINMLTRAKRAERIETLQAFIGRASYIDHRPTWRATIAAYRDESLKLMQQCSMSC